MSLVSRSSEEPVQASRYNLGMSLRIYVYEYSDDLAKPHSFTLDEKVYEITEVLEERHGPSALYFKVKTDEGKVCVLRYDGVEDEWSLQSGFSGE